MLLEKDLYIFKVKTYKIRNVLAVCALSLTFHSLMVELMWKHLSKASLLFKCIRYFHILKVDRNELIISAMPAIHDANLNFDIVPLPE